MTDTTTVRWDELLPREFLIRQRKLPLVYLPMGLCEPHGHVAAFGLDTHKAVYLCEEAARRFGGIVAPTQTYQIHETGYHRPWLAEVVGTVNPRLGSVPPDVLLRMFLFQLRAFANAGFRAIVAVTGHHGNQPDLRLVAEEFSHDHPVRTVAVSDPELCADVYPGDHAGRYEISQLLHVRPDLVDLGRARDAETSELGRFAQGPDATYATASHGAAIIEHSLDRIKEIVDACRSVANASEPPKLSIPDTERIWRRVEARRAEWCTLHEQPPDHEPQDYQAETADSQRGATS